MDAIVALDAGTTSVRALAFGPDLEELASAGRPLHQSYPHPGEVEHDAAEIAAAAVATLEEVAAALAGSGHVPIAVGVTNQRETTVAFDRERPDPLAPAIVWQDRRTASACAQLRARGLEDQVRATTGLVLDPYFSATKMAWLLERGCLDGATTPALATVDSWLTWWLTGGPAGGVFTTEPSNASRTALMDLATREWSAPMAELFGVPTGLLAPLGASGRIVGYVERAVVPALGGLPIAAVLGDQQAALFGHAGYRPGMVKATYGTGAFVVANAGATPPAPLPGLLATVAWDLGPLGGVTYALEGSAFVAGAAIEWLTDAVGLLASPAELEPLAATVPDAGGVRFIPALAGLGSPYWRPDVRGAVMGLESATTRAHLARAVIDALAFQVRAITDTFVDAGLALADLRIDGGVARMDLLAQLQATLCQVPVSRGPASEATARGVAALAGLVTGVWGSLDELSGHWSAARTFAPAAPAGEAAAYDAWTRAVDRLLASTAT